MLRFLSWTTATAKRSTSPPMDIAEEANPFTNGQCPVRNPKGYLNTPELLSKPESSLPTSRITSSIPRPALCPYQSQKNIDQEQDDDKPNLSNWEYPSPHQFYNALLKKGWDMPEEHAVSMVIIHNRLNEDAWREVLRWEARYHGGSEEAAKLELYEFSGNYNILSHKAKLYQLGRRLLPSYFQFAAPFDRHDWIVRRPATNKKLRYVIDYYNTSDGPLAEPVFHLDVRPASDCFANVWMRAQRVIEDNTAVKGAILASTVLVIASIFTYYKSSYM